MPKGSNPRSQSNLVAGKNKKNAVKTTLTLSPAARKNLQKSGNMSAAIESIFGEMTSNRLFYQSPIFSQCKHLLEMLAENPEKAEEMRDRIEAILLEMEDLEIEEGYREARLEGAIAPSKDCWIA
ncbi:MAG: hypothetical protein KatS3mg087_0597 [Patescibacteria group bacterium]|nr:MAG: hypothetical protein KatS3mg087_0597 [Patescibacteria group bacterium]